MTEYSRPRPTKPGIIVLLSIVSVLLCLIPGGYFAGMLLSLILVLLARSPEDPSHQGNLRLATGIALVFTTIWTVLAFL